jgi:hypothetical protein
MRKIFVVLSTMLFVLLFSACGGDGKCCKSPTEPTNCTIDVTLSSNNFSCEGGSGTVSATTQSGCSFTMTATSDSSWIKITSIGYRDANYVLEANNTGSRRSGSITAAGQVKVISQNECSTPTCNYVVEEKPQVFTYQGGNGGFSVFASSNTCSWTATSNVAWIAVNNGSGAGNGSVTYVTAGNGGAARTGTISVTGGRTVTVSQEAHP